MRVRKSLLTLGTVDQYTEETVTTGDVSRWNWRSRGSLLADRSGRMPFDTLDETGRRPFEIAVVPPDRISPMPQAAQDELLQQARSLTRERNYPSAIELYRQILATDPDCIRANESLALLYYATGDSAAAIEQYQKLIHLEPREARHCVNLGAIYNRLGQYQRAAETLRKAIARDKRNADAYYNLGIAERKLNLLPMAASAYKEAIRLNPTLAEAHQNLGNVYLDQHNYGLAIASYRKALEIRPDFEKAKLGLERAEEEQRKAKAAISPFGRLVSAETSRMQIQVSDTRELTDAERFADRQELARLSDELQAQLSECLDFLANTLGSKLIELQKVAADGKAPLGMLSRAVHENQEAFQKWAELRSRFRQKILQLRAHEDLLKSSVPT